ncbi:hypothetical protein Rin_00002070 [Candidatus Regiella insecticola 5.15]|uniref:Uncharacterized protein n=1 Tax=Candidatus Regiella insecticola 5.15 TaxID=1005043 RepID=G2GWS3_9ENTR|nr:hypothetical protein [Candidatus Regiella insecticola]EGY29810.1 hypothetical protein Rin_00002070 [Candidatus Regiella insecticola 5.15]
MNLTFSWRTLVGTLLLITLITLAMTIQSQYQENRQLKRSNQALRIERDTAWVQVTHYEKIVEVFNKIVGATQDAHQKAVRDSSPRIITIRKIITSAHCAHLPVPAAAVNRLRAHADQIPARPARAHPRHVAG